MKNQRLIYYILSLLILGLMMGCSEILGDREIIFPEITALAVGALIAPKQSWNVTPLRLFLSITIMAVCGVLIVKYVPLPKYFTLPIGFLLSSISLLISKSGFVPQFSACILPIVLDTTSFVYPVSVVVMTLIILLTQFTLVKLKKYEYRTFEPKEITPKRILYFFRQAIIVSLFFILPVMFKQMFFIVPPLIVGYLEMCEDGSKPSQNKLLAVKMIFIGALLGTVSKILFTDFLKLPVTVSAVLACSLLFVIMSKTKFYFPPCTAICTLPMLFSADVLWIYPLETCIGFSIMALTAEFLFTKTQPAKSKSTSQKNQFSFKSRV